MSNVEDQLRRRVRRWTDRDPEQIAREEGLHPLTPVVYARTHGIPLAGFRKPEPDPRLSRRIVRWSGRSVADIARTEKLPAITVRAYARAHRIPVVRKLNSGWFRDTPPGATCGADAASGTWRRPRVCRWRPCACWPLSTRSRWCKIDVTDKCRWRGGLSGVAKKKGGLPRPGRQGGRTERTTTMELNGVEVSGGDGVSPEELAARIEGMRAGMREMLGPECWTDMMTRMRGWLTDRMTEGGHDDPLKAVIDWVGDARHDDFQKALLVSAAAEMILERAKAEQNLPRVATPTATRSPARAGSGWTGTERSCRYPASGGSRTTNVGNSRPSDWRK